MNPEKQPLLKEVRVIPSEHRSLQEQVDAALKEGADKIILEGTFTAKEPGFCMLFLPCQRKVTIEGKNAVIDGKGVTSHLFMVYEYGNVDISGITFTGGNTECILDTEDLLAIPDVRFNIFQILDGGAMSVGLGATVVVRDCTFVKNHSGVCGGAISNFGAVEISDCLFVRNTCCDTGGAVDCIGMGSFTCIERCFFQGNLSNCCDVMGEHGIITVFPNAFLVVKESDFSEQQGVVIDCPSTIKKGGIVYDSATTFHPYSTPIKDDPRGNRGISAKIIRQIFPIFKTNPTGIRLEKFPLTPNEIISEHRQLFLQIVKELNSTR